MRGTMGDLAAEVLVTFGSQMRKIPCILPIRPDLGSRGGGRGSCVSIENRKEA